MNPLFADPLGLGSRFDALLARLTHQTTAAEIGRWPARLVEVPGARVRVLDTGAQGECVVFVPDGPNVIEHWAAREPRRAPQARRGLV